MHCSSKHFSHRPLSTWYIYVSRIHLSFTWFFSFWSSNMLYNITLIKNINIKDCFSYVYIWTPCTCLVPMNDSRWYQIFWKWSYIWLRATMWVLRIKPGSAGRAESTLKFWTISLVPVVLVLWWTLVFYFFSFKIILLILGIRWLYFICVCLCVFHFVIAFSKFFSVTLKNCQSRHHVLIQDLSEKGFHFLPSYIVIIDTDLFYM